MKVMVSGPPGAGKTTVSTELAVGSGTQLFHTDDLIDVCPWGEDSRFVADEWMSKDDFIIEGCAVARSLRKFMVLHPGVKPCDRLIVLAAPKVPLTGGRAAMAKGIQTVMRGIAAELLKLGVDIVHVDVRVHDHVDLLNASEITNRGD